VSQIQFHINTNHSSCFKRFAEDLRHFKVKFFTTTKMRNILWDKRV